ncbi:outer membrane assembly complex, YaeT protein [Orientia chuto str. Dubai]|uniref:Outer membrane protein assembly factor BamA n=1 Tax=Orientia chuto str. Dubai TaxID=1359168 RepID=A0A0F3MLM3_9RICK|nr:outer membrane protein assembly factor BamA [Candidatus Orientia mediorientalis]KJV56372.1 outer membrane assembly complex, YaeT protein [Orientia chuto str. Dubai]
MNKFIWYSLAGILFANLCSIVVADKIKNIEVIGNQRIESETIISKLGVSIGDELNYSKENDILLALHYTKFFKDVSISFIDSKLTVKVQEAPLITEVKLVNDSGSISKKALLAMITIKAGNMLIDSELQENITRLVEEYKAAGFFLAQVTSEISTTNNGEVVVTFKINEGPRVFIKKILFVGNNHYSDEKLHSVTLCKEKRWTNFASPLTFYNVMYIEHDKALLQQFYRNNGFAHCNISSSIELSPAKDFVVITYIIDEDKRFNFGKVSLETNIPSINTEEFSKFLKLGSNTLFNNVRLNNISQEITDALHKKGLHQVQLYPKIKYRSENSSIIDVVFVIDFAKEAYIRNINILGNEITQDYVIRREIKLIEGDVLDEKKLEITKKNIIGLNFIEDVIVSIVPVADSDYCDVLVEIKEGKRLRGLNLSAGYNSLTGLTGSFGFSWDNFIGTGKLISAELSIAKKNSIQSISIMDPNFIGSGFLGKLHLFHLGKEPSDLKSKSQTKENNNQYTVMKKYKGEDYYSHNVYGIGIEVDRNLTEHLIGTLGYTLKFDKGDTVSDKVIQNIYGENHDFIYSIVDGAVTYNRTDNFRKPKNGYFMRYGISFSGLGGTVKYLKNTVMAKFYKSFLDNKVTLMFVTRFSNIKGIFGEEINVYDLLKSSQDHLRGFNNNGIGPRIQAIDLRIGGTNSFTASSELFFPIGVPEELNARGSVFMDIGSIWGISKKIIGVVGNNNCFADSEKFSLRASIGVGLTFDIIGQPIKFFYAIPIKSEKYDEVERFGFSLDFYS